MKRNSTDLFKLSLLSFLFSIVFSASAEEYKSIIRYDRIWEHIYVYWDDTRAYHVRFAGTEEINGKTYHRLEAFREIRYTYDYDAQPKVLSIDDNFYEHEGYLREEDGKVYTLIVKDNSGNESHWADLYTPEEYEDLESCILEEKLLYDFTCDIGTTYRGLHLQKGCVDEMDYKVKSIEHVEIDGEEYPLLRVATYNYWYDEWDDFVNEPIIAGIGIADYGCLTTINYLFRPTCPCNHHMFNRLMSTDGRVLYRTENGCTEIPINDLFGVDEIRELTDNSESSAPIYDMLGRRIAEPAPGQLYIQDGKKLIAR